VTAADPPTRAALDELRRTRIAYQRLQRALRLLAPAAVVAAVAVGVHSAPRQHRALAVAALLAFGVTAAGALLTRGRPYRLHLVLLGLLTASSGVLLATGPTRTGLLGLLVVLAQGPWRPRSTVGVAVSAGAATVLLTGVIAGGRVSASDVAFTAITLGCLFAITYLSRRLGAANQLAETLLRDLTASRARELRLAALAERQSVARELHDILAHSLSGLLLQLEGARVLASEAPTDPRLPVAIERAHHLARAGLDEARQAVATLRDEAALPGPDQLAALVEQFRAGSGVPCELEVTGEPRALRPEVRLGVYRVAQEALTNIAKHAAASRARVRLDYGPDGVRLVVDDEAPSSVPAAGGGYGLSGMTERAELLGGQLSAGATEAGFRVELVVPA
jgi:signal transduction histidine kinase